MPADPIRRAVLRERARVRALVQTFDFGDLQEEPYESPRATANRRVRALLSNLEAVWQAADIKAKGRKVRRGK